MRTFIDDKGCHTHNGSTGLTVKGQLQCNHSNGTELLDVGPILEDLQQRICGFSQTPSCACSGFITEEQGMVLTNAISLLGSEIETLKKELEDIKGKLSTKPTPFAKKAAKEEQAPTV